MKHLKKYQFFLKENFDIQDTDKEDVKMSKEKMNDINKEIEDYKVKKSQIENLWKKVKNKQELEETEQLVKPIIGEGEKMNQFLVQLNTICRIETEVELAHEEIVKDKIRADEMRSEAALVKDATTKAAATARVTDIQNRIAQKNQEILDKSKKFEELDKEHKQKMQDLQKNIQEYIKKISDSEQK